ncbi:DUF6438 domain-containing protein [Pontibacter sp. H249]|uniref:DUF6438 domain-containing protein n=1 Tax=Pontibacter sp. H249 TaxID=3133420 RepID=UPI0030C1B12A
MKTASSGKYPKTNCKDNMPQALFNINLQLSSFVQLLLVSLVLSSCAGKGNAQTENKSQVALPLLQFQKAPCYGPCPAYEANIRDDGSISLISWGNIAVPEDDTVQLLMSEPELQQLKKAMADLQYTSLKDAYLSNWTDRPSSYLTFYQDGKEVKRVKHQEGGPENLVALLNSLHQQLMELIANQSENK